MGVFLRVSVFTEMIASGCASLCVRVWFQMGYANPTQMAAGIHTRLYSRAFIIDDGKQRVLFVTADVGMISQRLRLEVHIHTYTGDILLKIEIYKIQKLKQT